MKVKVCFMIESPKDGMVRPTFYTVSSILELFKRIASLRHRTGLVRVCISDKYGQDSLTIMSRHTEPGYYDFFIEAPIRFNQSELSDMDRLDELSGATWNEIMKFEGTRYDRTNNKVPRGIAKFKKMREEGKSTYID